MLWANFARSRNGLNGEIDGGRNGRTKNVVLNYIADNSDARRDNDHSDRKKASTYIWDKSAVVACPDFLPGVVPSAWEDFPVLRTSSHPGYREHILPGRHRCWVVVCMHSRSQ